MKIRNDFVTNSSSSSFVIARRSGCTIEEIESTLRELGDHIDMFLNVLRHQNYPDAEVTREEFVQSLAKTLFDFYTDLQLGDWGTSAIECSSDGNVQSQFLYRYGNQIQSENFKMGGRYA